MFTLREKKTPNIFDEFVSGIQCRIWQIEKIEQFTLQHIFKSKKNYWKYDFGDFKKN